MKGQRQQAPRKPARPPDPVPEEVARFDDEGGAMKPVTPLHEALNESGDEAPDKDDDPKQAEANELKERRQLKLLQQERKKRRSP